MKIWVEVIKLLRVKHYIKNVLILIPLFFAKAFYDLNSVFLVSMGFLVFSLTTSIVYILNDIQDIEKDKLHPIKRNRPFASGKISVKSGYRIVIVLIIISTILCITFKINVTSISLLFTYLMINLLYSFKLKQYPIIDVSIIAAGFVLRVLYGGAILNVPISNWLILTILAFSFFMAFGKRRNELIKNGNESRDVLSKYSKSFLDSSIIVSEGLLIVFYALWSLSENKFLSDQKSLIWSVPIVMLIVFRYSMILEDDNFGDPADIVFSDKILWILGACFTLLMSYIYLK